MVENRLSEVGRFFDVGIYAGIMFSHLVAVLVADTKVRFFSIQSYGKELALFSQGCF
jgi:hypothetical protein